MNSPAQSRLGKPTRYRETHDPTLLYPIERSQGRAALAPGAAVPFVGCDIWHGWELSWLDGRGKPCNAIARFRFDCHSPMLVESKSFKLYLNSLAQSRFDSALALSALLRRDLGAVSGAEVHVELLDPADPDGPRVQPLAGESLDALDIDITDYGPPRADLLQTNDDATVEETLVSRLFRSNCPVTGQPDWASVQIRYRGARIERAGLLRYLVSFRRHSGFHEQCVEAIFTDLARRCAPEWLDVYACFTRRGGLDINPWRSSRHRQPRQPAREPRQ